MNFMIAFFFGALIGIGILFLFFKHNSGQEQIQRAWTEMKNGKKKFIL